jgi:hypothetical protein
MQIQRFGIELRTLNDTKSLFDSVDAVLSKTDSKSRIGKVGDSAKIQTVAHALNKMLKTQNYFDVCTIDKCSELCQICISKERQAMYRSIHCMHWADMTNEYRQTVVAMVLDDFRTVLTNQENS